MAKLNSTVTITLFMREGETVEQAEARLFDHLYEGLCNAADHECEFWIESTSEEE